jgi:hypothetical protein
LPEGMCGDDRRHPPTLGGTATHTPFPLVGLLPPAPLPIRVQLTRADQPGRLALPQRERRP